MGTFFSGTGIEYQERTFNETSDYTFLYRNNIYFSFDSTYNIREEKNIDLIWQDPNLVLHKTIIAVTIIKETDRINVDLVAFQEK